MFKKMMRKYFKKKLDTKPYKFIQNKTLIYFTKKPKSKTFFKISKKVKY